MLCMGTQTRNQYSSETLLLLFSPHVFFLFRLFPSVCVCMYVMLCMGTLPNTSDMNKVCLPEDLIKEYAAKHPNAPGVTQTQKVFCLAMMMRQDKIEPFEETYR